MLETAFADNINCLQSLNIFDFQKCQVDFNNGRKELYTLSENNKNIFKPNGLLVTTGMVNNLTVIDIDDLKNPRMIKLNNLCRDTGTSFTKTRKGFHYYFNYTDKLASRTGQNYGFDILNENCTAIFPPASYIYKNVNEQTLIQYKFSKLTIENIPNNLLYYILSIKQANEASEEEEEITEEVVSSEEEIEVLTQPINEEKQPKIEIEETIKEEEKSKVFIETEKDKIISESELFKILDEIDIKFNERTDTWIKIIWAIYNVCNYNNLDELKIIHKFSSKASNYDEISVDNFLVSNCRNRTLNDSQLGLGTLIYYKNLSKKK